MRILLDENFPKSAADVIAAAGHEVLSFADVCEFGADDEEVFVRAQKLGAVILTSDRDFYHTVPLIHPEHCGIIVVALRQPNRKAILTRLQKVSLAVKMPLILELAFSRFAEYKS